MSILYEVQDFEAREVMDLYHLSSRYSISQRAGKNLVFTHDSYDMFQSQFDLVGVQYELQRTKHYLHSYSK